MPKSPSSSNWTNIYIERIQFSRWTNTIYIYIKTYCLICPKKIVGGQIATLMYQHVDCTAFLPLSGQYRWFNWNHAITTIITSWNSWHCIAILHHLLNALNKNLTYKHIYGYVYLGCRKIHKPNCSFAEMNFSNIKKSA